MGRSTRRSPGDGALFKRKDGYWVGGIELPAGPDGKRRSKRIVRKDRNEVLAELRRIKAAAAAGQIAMTTSTTVGSWLDFWLTSILPHRNVRPGTTISYRNTIRLYLKPRVGGKRLDRFSPADVRELYTGLQRDVSTRAAGKADQVLRLALKAAVREGIIASSVMDRVDKPAHTPKPQQAFNARVSMHIIRTAVETQGKVWGARWALGFTTGARESEVLGLEWDRVHLDEQVIDLSWQLQRHQKEHGCGEPVDGAYPCGKERMSFCPGAHWNFPPAMEWRECEGTMVWTRPKTKAGVRMLPLIPEMVPVLRELRDLTPNPHGLVFHHDDGSPFTQDQDQKMWRALLADSGLPHARQHTVRHSTATLLLDAGVDAHIIQSVIGHTDIATTRQYQHVDLELARRAWGNLGAILPTQQTPPALHQSRSGAESQDRSERG